MCGRKSVVRAAMLFGLKSQEAGGRAGEDQSMTETAHTRCFGDKADGDDLNIYRGRTVI